MKFLSHIRAGILSDRFSGPFAALAVAAFVMFLPSFAYAQDPFASATSAAQTVTATFKTFALAVGAIGMISCLLLGFFGKLNWKWVATGIGVSFAIAIVVPAITWLSTLA